MRGKIELRNLLRASSVLVMASAFSAVLGTSETAFETFKGFQGKWAIRSEGKTLPIEMSYEVASKGSIVTEQFGKELSVFYLDGQSLMMIHFCNAGNQPRLRLRESSSQNLLQFDVFDVTNLGRANTAHVQRIIYKIIDDKRMDLEIVWKRNGSQDDFERYSLIRI